MVPDQEGKLLGIVEELRPLDPEPLVCAGQCRSVDPSLTKIVHGGQQRPLDGREVTVRLRLCHQVERTG